MVTNLVIPCQKVVIWCLEIRPEREVTAGRLLGVPGQHWSSSICIPKEVGKTKSPQGSSSQFLSPQVGTPDIEEHCIVILGSWKEPQRLFCQTPFSTIEGTEF